MQLVSTLVNCKHSKDMNANQEAREAKPFQDPQRELAPAKEHLAILSLAIDDNISNPSIKTMSGEYSEVM